MKAKHKITATMALSCLMAAIVAVPASAQSTKSIFEIKDAKQTAKDFKPAPSKIETNFGTLEFTGGYPTPETVKKVYDELDLQRATQAYLDFIPALSHYAILQSQVRDYGVRSSSDILVYADKMNSTPLWLTGNTDSIYALLTLDLKVDGPTVIEIPPGVMGPIDDAYFKFVVDFGATGPDKGKGGKYLVLPPGYEGDVPDGYFVAKATSYRLWPMMRANAALVGSGKKALDFYRQLKVYPLASGPREGRYINASGMAGNAIAPEDATAFKWLHEIINYEPANLFNKEQLGRLASLGIEKGKPFLPDARMKKILEQGARQGVAMARTITFASRDPDVRLYPDMSWETPFIGVSSEFEKNGYRNLDARMLYHYNAIVITPAMAAKMPEGVGSQYASTYVDSKGKYLDGSNTYKLHVPANVPVKAFWSVTVYDPVTRSQLQTGQAYPSVNGQKNPQANADGSVDIYFAAKKPKGVSEKNWVQTVPGNGFFLDDRVEALVEAEVVRRNGVVALSACHVEELHLRRVILLRQRVHFQVVLNSVGSFFYTVREIPAHEVPNAVSA